ncbi:aminodeoxychorismate/anthranilate synthase component II [Pseudodesulfovibrio sp. JC047]|uniref:aminodeoxychorismate/anthranilate synthase component II n=1 Tax=Pseudodesulfovibrio sp. JC047 TaxID=2683199 RepID=UPI0013D0D90B|nr:aminodeoxychorismate/anthranilate synthase component II [Pseudodesulfovibrio sp. JC047]NDV19939.1 aminodeoxychorismate/anthranilate synthase component II [Pseudodesulfovibrio sp. JC047]
MHILLIDNNDSFTRNLEHLLISAVKDCSVVITPYSQLQQFDFSPYDLIVISPGPGEPAEYPGYETVFRLNKPVLGICLGMQIMNALHGGTIGRLDDCVHGKTDVIEMDGETRVIARYHSLKVNHKAPELNVFATNADGTIMCLGNADKRILGYQFHPESFLTPNGGWYIAYALRFLGIN